MKRAFLLLICAIAVANVVIAQSESNLPKKLYAGAWKAGHVQGIAVDAKHEFVYVSFTTMLVKMNMQGEVVGTVTGILGHLGCLEFNEEDGRLYGSLEYKNDVIGKGILRQEGVSKQLETGFYVAIFDVDKITRRNMSAERDNVMTTVLLKTVVEDFEAEVADKNGNPLKHRHGCSGFDGISFGPAFDGGGRRMLTVAYGVYGDNNRSDNDYQVLLQYDTRGWSKYEQPLSQDNMHRRGPAKPHGKYFVYTGNTTWGVQNLEYDKHNNIWLLACYAGKKPHFPNYTLFAVDAAKKAVTEPLRGVGYRKSGAVLSLVNQGDKTKAQGWHNQFGAYGIHALGGGYFYIVSGEKSEQGQSATLHLARFVGTPSKAFEMVE